MALAALILQTLPPLESFSKYVELFALHGVYFIAMWFLVYQQRRAFKDFQAAAQEIDSFLRQIRDGQIVNEILLKTTQRNQDYLRRIHLTTVVASYCLISIATSVWIYATFFYTPKTALWGSIGELTRTVSEPVRVGDVNARQQIAPLQSNVTFYEHFDLTGPLKWALVKDGRHAEVPLLIKNEYREKIRRSTPLDPNQPDALDTIIPGQKQRCFVVRASRVDFLLGNPLDYEYSINKSDPRDVGALQLVKDNGQIEAVQMYDCKEVQQASASSGLSGVDAFLGWISPIKVFAQGRPDPKADAAKVGPSLTWLGSNNLSQQLAAERTLDSAAAVPWDNVRKMLDDPKGIQDERAFIRNLSEYAIKKQTEVPADVRLTLAQKSYFASDFQTSSSLFKGLTETDLAASLKSNPMIYYYRGVSNLETRDYTSAAKDLKSFVEKAPSASAREVGSKALIEAEKKANQSRPSVNTSQSAH